MKTFLQKLAHAIYGEVGRYEFEEQVFFVFTFANGWLNLIGCLSLLHTQQWVSLFAQLIAGIVFLLAWYLGRFQSASMRSLYVVFVTTIVAFLSTQWILEGGFAGIAYLYWAVAMVIVVLAAPTRPFALLGSTLLLVGVIFLVTHDYFNAGTNNDMYRSFWELRSNFLIVVLLVGVFCFWVAERLKSERRRANLLLDTVMPPTIARELRLTQRVEARRHQSVTILFMDFVSFTKISSKLEPGQLTRVLDVYFTAFDEIMQWYRVEKIKTIGDGYLAVCGLDRKIENHQQQVVEAASRLLEIMPELTAQLAGENLPGFDIKIGVHTGEVTSGIIGADKFAYDIWGNAVNFASRVVDNGIANRVNVSQEVYDKIAHLHTFERIDGVQAKNIGEISIYVIQSTSKNTNR